MAKAVDFTYEDLAKVLDYDPLTGEFTWKVSVSSRALAGGLAFGLGGKDYAHHLLDKLKDRTEGNR